MLHCEQREFINVFLFIMEIRFFSFFYLCIVKAQGGAGGYGGLGGTGGLGGVGGGYSAAAKAAKYGEVAFLIFHLSFCPLKP